MAAAEAIVDAEAEEGTEEAIEDKEKSIHRSIGGNNIDESSGGDSNEIPARFQRRLR